MYFLLVFPRYLFDFDNAFALRYEYNKRLSRCDLSDVT